EQVVEDVQQYLATYLAAQVTLAEISNQVGLSPNYLCALFREQTGKTIFEHLGYLRLKKAQFLLRNTQLPIYSIAEQVGYSSQFAFSKFFRKAMGISPTSYRESKEEVIDD
ncbi:MAG TPA: helix-turn-helix domain-containing protein, partial [Bacillota bacterium]|nr:helix-turn-helix domain-containing protein [Bacillota bacterium]